MAYGAIVAAECKESRFIAQKTRDGAEYLAPLGMTVFFQWSTTDTASSLSVLGLRALLMGDREQK
jgi:hypothetical protein